MSGPMQWTPRGMIPAAVSARPREIDDEDEDDATAVEPPPPQQPRQQASTKPLNVVALARRRLREIKSELRRMRQLERERDELQRLVDAASNRRPRAVVKTIARAAS